MIYGSSRLGTWKSCLDLLAYIPAEPEILVTDRGSKQYEMNDHLGNVHAVVSDRKKRICDEGEFAYYEADIRSTYDYYAFGMMMPGRDFSTPNGYGVSCDSVPDSVMVNMYDIDFMGYPASWTTGNTGVVWYLNTPDSTYSENGQLLLKQIYPFLGAASPYVILPTPTLEDGETYYYEFDYDAGNCGTLDSIGFYVIQEGTPNMAYRSDISAGGHFSGNFGIDSTDTYFIGIILFGKDTCTSYLDNFKLWYYRDTTVYACDSSVIGPGSYRFGFNGQLKDDEVYGEGNSYTAEYWQYDPRLGRRWETDPIIKPWESSYAAFHNNPIFFIDPLGLEGVNPDPPTGGGDFGGFESCGGCGTTDNPIMLNKISIGPGTNEAEVDNTGVSMDVSATSSQLIANHDQQFIKQGVNRPSNINQSNPLMEFYNKNKTTVNGTLYTAGLPPAAVQEILNNSDAVAALRQGKMLAVYNGEVRVWSLNFHGNKSVPSVLVGAQKLAFLDKTKPLLRFSNAAGVAGNVFGVVSLGLNVVEVIDQPSSVDNWINLGVGTLSLHPYFGWTVYPSYMIMRGAIESPQSFFGGPSKGFSGENLHYTPTYCFIAGTKILMADGSQKNIEDVKIGDIVKSYNFETNQIEDKPVLKIDSPIHKDLVDITFNDGVTNSNTFDHPYFVKGKGWCSYMPELTMQRYGLEAKALEIGDTCYFAEGDSIKEIEILSIKENWGERNTYNLTEVEGNHNFFANGVLVHNKHVIPGEMEDVIMLLEMEDTSK